MDLAYALRLLGSLVATAIVCRALRRGERRSYLFAGVSLLGAFAVVCQALASEDAGAVAGAGATVIGPALVALLAGKNAAPAEARSPKPRARWSLRLTLEREPKEASAPS